MEKDRTDLNRWNQIEIVIDKNRQKWKEMDGINGNRWEQMEKQKKTEIDRNRNKQNQIEIHWTRQKQMEIDENR